MVYGDSTSARGLTAIAYQEMLSGCSTVLLDGFYPDQGLPLLIMAQGQNIMAVLDAGSWKDGMTDLLPCVDFAICSADFMPPGCSTSGDVFSYLAAQGIIDPVKVTRSAVENAASIGAMILTTEALITDLPQEEVPMPAAPDMGMGGMGF